MISETVGHTARAFILSSRTCFGLKWLHLMIIASVAWPRICCKEGSERTNGRSDAKRLVSRAVHLPRSILPSNSRWKADGKPLAILRYLDGWTASIAFAGTIPCWLFWYPLTAMQSRSSASASMLKPGMYC